MMWFVANQSLSLGEGSGRGFCNNLSESTWHIKGCHNLFYVFGERETNQIWALKPILVCWNKYVGIRSPFHKLWHQSACCRTTRKILHNPSLSGHPVLGQDIWPAPCWLEKGLHYGREVPNSPRSPHLQVHKCQQWSPKHCWRHQ